MGLSPWGQVEPQGHGGSGKEEKRRITKARKVENTKKDQGASNENGKSKHKPEAQATVFVVDWEYSLASASG